MVNRDLVISKVVMVDILAYTRNNNDRSNWIYSHQGGEKLKWISVGLQKLNVLKTMIAITARCFGMDTTEMLD